MIPEDVDRNFAIEIYVGVEHFGGEPDFGWSEGVILGKMNIQEEHSSLVRTIIGANDGALPVKQVVLIGPCVNIVRQVLLQVFQFFSNPLNGHPSVLCLFARLIHTLSYLL